MDLTEEQIQHSFWKWSPDSGWPPMSVETPEEYDGGELLSCIPTQQLNFTPFQQKKITKRWVEAIPSFKNLKILWFHSRVTQDIFDAACRLPNIEGLYIKWSGIKSLRAVVDCPSLKHLHVGSSTQVESIEPLTRMTGLITLSLESLKKIEDYSPLSTLTNLQGLSIDGSVWTTQSIRDLEFLRSLTNLRYFTMTNSRLRMKFFDPILSLEKLERFSSSWNYPVREFEKLKSHAKLRYGNIETSWKEIKEQYEH